MRTNMKNYKMTAINVYIFNVSITTNNEQEPLYLFSMILFFHTHLSTESKVAEKKIRSVRKMASFLTMIMVTIT